VNKGAHRITHLATSLAKKKREREKKDCPYSLEKKGKKE